MKKAKEEKFLQQNSTSSIVQNNKNDRYEVSSFKNDLNSNPCTYNAHLRSFKCTIPILSTCETYYALLMKIERLIYSRYDSTLTNYPTSLRVLCKNTSLRYLHVVHGELHITYPKSISQLQNLETFIIRSGYGNGGTVPSVIWKLPRLRHIVLGRYCNLEFPAANERGYPILESLQTLIGMRNLNFTMDVIKRIPNVKIMKLRYDPQAFSINNLQHLHKLEKLSFKCKMAFDYLPSDLVVYPRNLKKLSLDGITVPFMSIIGSLPYLEVLKLKVGSLMHEIWEPVEGEFLQLKYLKMEYLYIKDWRVESFHFPCLQKLEIKHCWYLEEVPESVGEIDTLEELVLNDCPKAKESVEKIEENQQAVCNDLLKITIIDRD